MGTNVRSNFADFFGQNKLPELEAVILAVEESYPSLIPFLYNEESMSTDIYQTTTISGLQNPQLKAENTPIVFQTLKSGYSKTYTANTYATGYRISKESVDDGKFNFIERATKSFGKGHFEIKEYDAASVLDDGFSVTGYDGQYLFSTSHPLENGDGVTGSNTATAAELSITSARELRNVMQSTLNENAQIVKYKPAFLVVPQDLQDVAKEITQSMYNPEDANNAINTLYDSLKLVPGGFWNYLSSSTAWFMFAEKMEHHLMFMTRQSLQTDSDYDKKALAWELTANCRYDKGYSNWRGVAGNAGA